MSVERPHLLAKGVRARQTRLMSVALDGGKPKYLGEDWRHEELTGAQDRIIDWLPDEPNFIVIGLWSPEQNGVSARRVNVINGGLHTIVRARYGTLGWAADHRHQVRAGRGEVHGFIDERNRIDFYTKLGAFFQRHLMDGMEGASETASAEAGQAQ